MPKVVLCAPNRPQTLFQDLRTLNLSCMARLYPEVAMAAAQQGLSHEAFLAELVRVECEHRSQQRRERRLVQSKLPREKTFATLQLDRYAPALQLAIERLRTGAFVRQAVNVIAVGRPGSGKSHVIAALGADLIALDYPVLWTTTATLVQRLLAAKRDLRLPQELAKLAGFAALILDDIGYVQHSREEMEVLFTLLADRYEKRSVLITTNLVFSDWNQIFKDPMTTMAAVDRVVHHSVILDFLQVQSYRVQAAQQATRPQAAEDAP
jgi:DNA replication protein DnaC